jgi:hypothetical protein
MAVPKGMVTMSNSAMGIGYDPAQLSSYQNNYEMEIRRLNMQMAQMEAENKMKDSKLVLQFSIHKAVNGYILKCNSEQYIMSNVDDLSDQLKVILVKNKFEQEGV